MLPPKPLARPDKVSLWRYLKLFRAYILSAQPKRLYHAWMAEFRTPFFRSYMCNDPDLIRLVLKERPHDFPKSERIGEGLKPLLGRSVFVTNGPEWRQQRRIINPAFEGGRLRQSFAGMLAAADAGVMRLKGRVGDVVEVESFASHTAADVIFRTLFSIPIEHDVARKVFAAFQRYQRGQPLINLAAFWPVPAWVPRLHRPGTARSARIIRRLIEDLTKARMAEIKAGTAPDDLATKIMTTPDPETGVCFTTAQMVDQVAIFFLAGHETSASALAWALYLLAQFPDVQEQAAAEVAGLSENPTFSDASGLNLIQNVFREALRLYPPVPMMVRENLCPERLRGRDIAARSQIVLSPWHVQRHDRIWDRPDEFDPGRWKTAAARTSARDGYLPFSAGPRVCPGAGFAMLEGPLLLAMLLRNYRFDLAGGPPPVPIAHLTVRSRDGIRLRVQSRR
jgi:cytochrome P450